MSDSNLTQQDVKSFLNDGVGLVGASAEDAMSYFQNNYGDVKGLEAYKLFNQAKVGIASTGLSWDSNKTTG